MSDSASEKKTKGQRVLPLRKIENKNALAATFCKRRMGLFKKANEICTLCAAQIALIISSPSGKSCYTFGHPNVDSVIKDYMAKNGIRPHHLDQVRNGVSVEKLCEELAEVRKEAKSYQSSNDELIKIINDNSMKSWWRKAIEDMNVSELEDCKKVMEMVMAVTPEDTGSNLNDGVELDLVLRM